MTAAARPAPAGSGRMFLRALARRCPRCGGRRVLRRWFHLRERCPTCGYRIRREEGFFTGVLLVNLAVALVVMFAVLFAWIVWHEATDSDSGLVPVLLLSIGIAVVAPIVVYPYATTIWMAMDLATHPLEPDEQQEAEAAVAAAVEGPSGAAEGT